MPHSAQAPSPTSRTSPVTAAYTRLTEVLPMVSVTELSPTDPLPEGEGWVRAAGLAAAGAELDAFLAWDETQILRDYGREGRPDVVAAFGLHRYSWYACLLFTVPWFLQRRVPRFPAGHVAFQREQSRLVVRGETFSCLPGDPAAGEPGARVVPDEEALRAEVRAAFAEHIEPVLGGFGPRMRRRGRALWGMATDEIVEGIWYIAELLGADEQERCRRELELLLPGTTRPYVGGAGFRELTGPGGESLPTRDRASCCMFYTLAPDDTCVTCPRTCDADRITKLTTASNS
ncbi:(2Fe-2S)-binding protein [Streptomyces europaeiscabiei]|uniref:(2Fe-2S)-binding protein n=1 Tax=Streptomyces TaxID=1883 RepID=UPI0015C4F4D7|nr:MULTISPECIES: (2Fe-2S)-binding protein [Streptomyces]MDX3587926.1 (2Fe-2S)-binding protein [Streptomyces europaeiscabiei]MDX3614544.1 (2Fe-2S)-binding protein [Streptomyces europaeiscabiei]MDX3628848.1 (2Fe-2S)-binding protein [Streptomyces europaeiscabiei]MDX3646994.1 (2Fe-2S)-binding protein [Streptomyces europaeiscabiei]WUD36328.1 (2Fe-2S)-binding protein [Streptomyces europaeiscabiei]